MGLNIVDAIKNALSGGSDSSSSSSSSSYDINYDELDRNDSYSPYLDPNEGAKKYQSYQDSYQAYQQAQNDWDTYGGGYSDYDSAKFNLDTLRQNAEQAEQDWKSYVNNPLVPSYNPSYKSSDDLNGGVYGTPKTSNPFGYYYTPEQRNEDTRAAAQAAADFANSHGYLRTNDLKTYRTEESNWQEPKYINTPKNNLITYDSNDNIPEIPEPRRSAEGQWDAAQADYLNMNHDNSAYNQAQKDRDAFTKGNKYVDQAPEYNPWETPEQKHDDTSAYWSTRGDLPSDNPLFPSGRLESEEGGYVDPRLKKAGEFLGDVPEAVDAIYSGAKANAYYDAAKPAAEAAAEYLDYTLALNFDTLMAYAEDRDEWKKAYDEAVSDIIEATNRTYGEDTGAAEQMYSKIQNAQNEYLQVINDTSLTNKQKQERIAEIKAAYSDASDIAPLRDAFPMSKEADALIEHRNEVSPGRYQGEIEYTPEQQQMRDSLVEILETTDDTTLRKLIKENLDTQFVDNLYGTGGSAYASGNVNEYTNQIAAKLGMTEDEEERKKYAERLDGYQLLCDYIGSLNKDALETNGFMEGMVASNIAYLPQLREQIKSRSPAVAISTGVGALLAGAPGAVAGAKFGNIVGSIPYSYESMFGSAIRDIMYSEQGQNLTFDQIVAMARDESIINTAIEFKDTAVDTLMRFPGAGKLFKSFGGEKAVKTVVGQVMKFIAGTAESGSSEYGEEAFQRMVSIANQRRVANGELDSGPLGLLKSFTDVFNEAFTAVKNGDWNNELLLDINENGMGGLYIGALGYPVGGLVNNTVTSRVQNNALDIVNSLDRNKTRSGIYEGVIDGTVSEENAKDFNKIAKGKTEEEFKAGLDAFEKHNANTDFESLSKGDVVLDGDNNPVGTVTRRSGKKVVIEFTDENGNKTTETVDIVGTHGYLDAESKTVQVLDDGGKIVSAEDAADVASFKTDAEAKRKAAEARKAGAKAKAETDSGTGTPGNQQAAQQDKQSEQPAKKAPAPGKPASSESTDSGTGTPVGEQPTQSGTDTTGQPAKKAATPGKPASAESTDSGTGTVQSSQQPKADTPAPKQQPQPVGAQQTPEERLERLKQSYDMLLNTGASKATLDSVQNEIAELEAQIGASQPKADTPAPHKQPQPVKAQSTTSSQSAEEESSTTGEERVEENPQPIPTADTTEEPAPAVTEAEASGEESAEEQTPPAPELTIRENPDGSNDVIDSNGEIVFSGTPEEAADYLRNQEQSASEAATDTTEQETPTTQEAPKSKAQEFFDNNPQKGRVYTSNYKGATVKIKNNGDGTYTVSMASPLKNGTGFSKAAKTIGTVSSIDEANQLIVDEYNKRNPGHKAFSDAVGTTSQKVPESPTDASPKADTSTPENGQESSGVPNEKLNQGSTEESAPGSEEQAGQPAEEKSEEPKQEKPDTVTPGVVTGSPEGESSGSPSGGSPNPPPKKNNIGARAVFGKAYDLVKRITKRHNRNIPRSSFSNERTYYRLHGKTNESMRNFKNISRLSNNISALLNGTVSFREFSKSAENGRRTAVVGNVLDERMRQELAQVAAMEKDLESAEDIEKAREEYQEAAAKAAAHLVARMEMVEQTERAKAKLDKLAKDSGKKGKNNKAKNAMDWYTRMQISGDNFWRMMGNWDKNGNNEGYSYANAHNRTIATRISEESKLKGYYAGIDTNSKEFKDFASGKTMSDVDFGGHKISLMEAIKFVKLVDTMNEYDRVNGNPDMNRVSSLDGFCFKDGKGNAVFVDIEGDQNERIDWINQRYQDALDEINNNKSAKAYMEATESMYEEASKDANKVFSNVNGYDRYMYGKGNYTDIHYANRDGSVDFSYNNRDATDVHDTGIMQNRTRDLGGYVIVNPMSQSVDAYISQISDYIAFEEFGQKLDVLHSNLTNGGSLNRTIKDTYGEQFDKWFDNYVKTMTLYKVRGEELSKLDKGLQRARQLMMSGALVGSVSVPLKQVSSYFDTMGMLDPRAVTAAFRPVMKMSPKGINNPLVQSRVQSIADPDFAELFNDKGIFSGLKDKKIGKFLFKATNIMDSRTVANVYRATILDVQFNSGLTKEQLYKNGKNIKDGLTPEGQFYVDSKFEQVLLGTQPIFTPQARNELARTDNQFLKMFQTFRTQQTQNYNRMLQTWNEFQAAEGSDKGEAGKKFAQTMTGHIAAAASLSALTAIANSILHKHRRYKDDDDELDDEKFGKKFLYGMVESMFGNYLWAGDLTKWMIDLYNSKKDPNWDWKYSSKESQYFDIGDKIHIPIISSGAIGTALQVLNSTISLCADVNEYGWTDSNKLSARYVAGNIATAFGAPANNVYYFMNAVYQWYMDAAYAVTGDKKYDQKYDDFITQMLKVDYSQQNRLVNAILKGDNAKIDDMFENLGESKFANSVYYGALDKYKSGKIDRDEYIDMLVDFGGKTYNDAVKDVDKKIAMIDSGISQFNGIDGRDGRAAFYDQYSDRFKSRDVYKDFFTDVKNGKGEGKHKTYYTTYNGQKQEVSANQSSIIDRMNENIRAGNFDYNTAKLLWENYYGYSTSKYSAWQFVGK